VIGKLVVTYEAKAHIVVYTPRDDDTRAKMPLTRRNPATAQLLG
jgi:hypothetical protein